MQIRRLVPYHFYLPLFSRKEWKVTGFGDKTQDNSLMHHGHSREVGVRTFKHVQSLQNRYLSGRAVHLSII